MNNENPSIYEQLLQPTSDFIERLMGEGGEAMLDQQILKMRDQMGEEEFNQYAEAFFSNTKINYKTFFGQEKEKSKELAVVSAEKSEVPPQEEIKHSPKKQEKQAEQEEILQPVPVEQQEFTNNSQQVDSEYQQIEKTDLGNSRFRIKYKNGDVYQGQMQQGMKSGWGDYYYQSGEKYSGCFIDDEINGYGRYYFLSGAEYEGDWSSGMKHGIGILKFANKDVYEGGFSNDDLHGKGIYRYVNGDLFDGNFRKGKREGAGTFQGADGRYQKGEWINDKFQV